MSRHSNYKTYWCVDAYACRMVKILGKNPFTEFKGNHVRRCPKGSSCRGAHFEEEFRLQPWVSKFKSTDFSKMKLGDYYEAIIRVLNEANGKVQDADLARQLANFRNLNFVDILHLWVKVYLYGSKEKKRGKSFPRMRIDNPAKNIIEDHMWVLEKLTHCCPVHMEEFRRYKTGERITIRETCLGGINCKHGGHPFDNVHDMINVSDLLSGVSDDKMTLEDYSTELAKINKMIDDLSNRVVNMESTLKNNETGNFLSKKKKKIMVEKVSSFKKLIHQKKRDKNKIPRKVHLTEMGLVPLCVYLNKKKVEVNKERAKLEETKDVSKKTRRKVIKKPKF